MKILQYIIHGLLIVICFYTSCSDISGQITTIDPGEISIPVPKEDSHFCRNSIYVELLGSGVLYSVNYDHRIGNKLSIRAGLSMWSIKSLDFIIFQLNDIKFRSFPIMINYLAGNGSSKLELGAGIMPTYISSSVGTVFYMIKISASGHRTIFPLIGTIGYRYQPEEGGIVFRAGVSPSLSSGDGIFNIGISFGYGF